MGLFGPKAKPLVTYTLTDPDQRAAADYIDQKIGKKNNHEITLQDLKTAESLVEAAELNAGEATKWHPDALAMVKAQLPALWKAYSAHEEVPTVVRERYSAVALWAIADPALQKAASFVARREHKQRGEITIKDVAATRVALADLEAKKTPKDPELTKLLSDGIASGAFVPADFQRVAVYLSTGMGAITSHPVRINGRLYADVYRLPLDVMDTQADAPAINVDGADADEEGAEGEAKGEAKTDRKPAPRPRQRSENEIERAVEEYVIRFKRSGYDQVFFLGADKQLYVALNSKGPVDKVQEGFRVQFEGKAGNLDSSVVLRVVETNNSIADATIGFWGKLVRKLGDTMNALLFRRIDKRLEAAASRVDRASKDKLDNAQREDLSRMVVTGGTVAALGAAVASAGAVLGEFPLVTGSVAGIGAVMTAVQVVDYLTTRQDKTAILHAAGHVVATDEGIVH